MSAVHSSVMSPNRRYQSMQALGLAILIEAAIVVGAAVILIGTPPVKPALSDAVPITLTEEPPPEKPPEPKPVPPVPVPQPKLKAVVKPAQPKPPTPQPPQETPPVADAPSEVAAAPTAFTQPAVAPPPPPPPPASGKADAQVTYSAKVNAAVRVSHKSNYPPAAAMIHFPGEAQVEFHLRDGILVGEPRILESCGKGIFDQSAVLAVRLAHYPEPPAELRGDELTMKVWVQFEH